MLPRLTWLKERGRLIAYPAGRFHPERCAEIQYVGSLSLGAEIGLKRWQWSVQWPGWFNEKAILFDLQECSDAANDAWWAAVQSPIPRDVETEMDIVAARVLVMPPPNSLFSEDPKALRHLIHILRAQYEADMKRDTVPAPVHNLLRQLSEELHRRRLSGQSDDNSPNKWGVTRG